MLSCRDTTELVSQSQDRGLTLRERAAVRLHLVICFACRRMVRQMAIIRAVAQHLRAAEHDESAHHVQRLPEAAAARIASKLRQAGE